MTLFRVVLAEAYVEAETKEEAWQEYLRGHYEYVHFDSSINDMERA